VHGPSVSKPGFGNRRVASNRSTYMVARAGGAVLRNRRSGLLLPIDRVHHLKFWCATGGIGHGTSNGATK
jgi:hypothetical protein